MEDWEESALRYSIHHTVLLTCKLSRFHDGALATYYLNRGDPEGQTTIFTSLLKLQIARSAVKSQNSEDLELLPLLNDFRCFSSSDPRDKIIALFGLTSTDLNEMRLVADYHSKPEELFINVAKSMLITSVTLDLLSFPRGSSALPLPLWVPDWYDTSPEPYSFFRREGSSSIEFPITPFNASGPSTAPVPIFRPDNSVILLGHHIADISSLTATCPETRFDWELLKSKENSVTKYGKGLRDLCKYAYNILEDVALQRDTFTVWDNTVLGPKLEHSNDIYTATGETVEMAYVRTLCGDDMPEGPEAALKSFRKVAIIQTLSCSLADTRIRSGGKSAGHSRSSERRN